MMTTMKFRQIAAGVIVMLSVSTAGAAVPDRDWPSVVPTPLLDVPMRWDGGQILPDARALG